MPKGTSRIVDLNDTSPKDLMATRYRDEIRIYRADTCNCVGSVVVVIFVGQATHSTFYVCEL